MSSSLSLLITVGLRAIVNAGSGRIKVNAAPRLEEEEEEEGGDTILSNFSALVAPPIMYRLVVAAF